MINPITIYITPPDAENAPTYAEQIISGVAMHVLNHGLHFMELVDELHPLLVALVELDDQFIDDEYEELSRLTERLDSFNEGEFITYELEQVDDVDELYDRYDQYLSEHIISEISLEENPAVINTLMDFESSPTTPEKLYGLFTNVRALQALMNKIHTMLGKAISQCVERDEQIKVIDESNRVIPTDHVKVTYSCGQGRSRIKLEKPSYGSFMRHILGGGD